MLPAPTISELDIPVGWRGTSATIQAMQKLVSEGKRDYAILEARSMLAGACPGQKDYLCLVQHIYDYIKSTIKFVRDPFAIETVQAPTQTIQLRSGDCDDFSILFNALCEAAGLQTWFKTIAADRTNPSEFSHVYSVVEIPKVGVVPADCTEPEHGLGWEPQGYRFQLWPGSVEGR